MKKIVSLVLCLAILASFGVPVFATEDAFLEIDTIIEEATEDELEEIVIEEELSENDSDTVEPFAVTASGTCGANGDNLTWSLDDAGTLTISGTGKMYSWSSYSSTPWYSSRSSIKKVTIENGVTSIGKYAFRDCDALTSIEIPASVTSIGEDAFYYCAALKTVTFAEGAKLTFIHESAFSSCDALTSIEIPASVTFIGSSAFCDCEALTSINVDEDNENYSNDERGALFNKDKTNLMQYPIGNEATSYEIPASVTGIGEYAFRDCAALKTVTFAEGSKLPSIGSYAFQSCDALTSIEIPASVTSIGSSAFSYCDALKTVTFAEGSKLTSIGSWAFGDCDALTSIEIPASVTGIGEEAFYSCAALTSIEIPVSVTSIGSSAFCDCEALTSINVDEDNENYSSDERGVLFNEDKTTLIQYPIGNEATSYEIPASVTSIGSYAFYDCDALKTVTFAEGSKLTSIGSYAFYDCDALTSIEIPASVTEIGSYAFYGCYDLKTVTFAEGSKLTGIGDYAFSNCDALTSIEIPASVTGIGSDAFSNCDAFTSIEIPASVTSIGSSAFSYSALKNVYYNGVKSQWVKIEVGTNNARLNSATIHYNGTAATGVSLNFTEFKLTEGETGQLTATVHPEGASDKSISWESSNKAVATVDNGVVTAVSAGSAVITVTTADGGFQASCTVTVTAPPTVLSRDTVLVLDNSGSMIGEPLSKLKTAAINFCTDVINANGENRIALVIFDSDIVYTSFTEDITVLKAKINSMDGSGGTETGDALLKAYDLISTSGNADVKSVVLMTDGIPNSESEAKSAALKVMAEFNLYALGFFHNNKTGEALLKSMQNSGYYEVTDPNNLDEIFSDIGDAITKIHVTGLELDLESLSLTAGESKKLNAVITPHDATNKTIYWSSSNESVAKVSADGTITTIAEGKVTITALTADGNLKAECTLIVNSPEAWWYTYTITDGEVQLTGFRPEIGSDIKLPSYIEGYPVTSIGEEAFYNCAALTSIEIPASVTSIGSYAFYNCAALTSINVDEDNEYYTSDERGVLFNEDKTTLIQYPIGDEATSYEIPASVTEIGDDAFRGCAALTSIEIPASVTSIGSDAFLRCAALTSINVDEDNENYSSDERGVLFNEDKTTLIQYPIGNEATSYEIPASVTEIGSYAFSYCTALTAVTFAEGSKLTSIGSDAFSYCTGLTSIEIPAGVTSIGSFAFYNCAALKTVTFAEGSKLPSIGSYAFYDCTALTSIEIPSSVTSIGERAFWACDRLVIYGYSGSYAESYAESNNIFFIAWDRTGDIASGTCGENLTWVLGRDLTLTISGTGDMDNWSNSSAVPWYSYRIYIKKVCINEGVTSIGYRAFPSCAALTSIEIPASVTSIGGDAFKFCDALKTVTFAEGSKLTSIGSYAFYDCDALTTVTFAEGSKLTGIGYRAFDDCDALTSIEIPASVTSIGEEAFYSCAALKKATVYSRNATINNDNFKYCHSDMTLYGYAGSTTETYATENSIPFVAIYEEIATYTVTYNANGGTGAPASQTKTEDVALTLSSIVPTRSGYKFLGWAETATGTTKYQPGGSYTENADITLYAVWEYSPKTYTVTYNANGGTNAPESQIKTEDVALILSSTVPTRSGYKFLGWATSATGTAIYQPGESYTANSSITLYALWEYIPKTYTVTYNANGGSGAPESQTKTEDVALILSSTVPTRSGYKFLGWAETATGTVAYAPGASYTENADITLYAVWEYIPKTYTVTYNANGGTTAPASQTKTEGVALTLSDDVPTRSGYKFLGWATTATGTVAYAPGASYTADATLSLYAVWEYIPKTYAVTYNANGGANAPSSQTKTEDVALILSSTVPTRSGYKFLGWAETATGTTKYQPGASYTENADITLYAVWEKENVVTPDSPTVFVVDTKGRAGKTVSVDINIKNNPGIALISFYVHYNNEVMTLESASLGDVFTGELNCNLNPVPFIFNVYTGSANKTGNGTLVTLYFKIAEDCPEGKYEIKLTDMESLNIDEEYVYFTIENGEITVKNVAFGDTTGDGEITRNDLLRLAKYFSGYDVEIDEDAADVNGDGEITRADLLRLAKYFSGFDVELGK